MENNQKRLFVLDTNVLMHDPLSLFQFDEHDVFLPMVVLEELDGGKKGASEVARNVRQISRYLDELVQDLPIEAIAAGITIPPAPHGFTPLKNKLTERGKLFLQTRDLNNELPDFIPGNQADHRILATAHALAKIHKNREVILVSKDINLRIKAATVGVPAQDYFSDRAVDDIRLLHHGTAALPNNFWEQHSTGLNSWQENGETFYRIKGPLVPSWQPNLCLYTEEEKPFMAVVRSIDQEGAVVQLCTDYLHSKHHVWGIQARNKEQNFAINFLMDPNIDLVSLEGQAGTGKTLLALASGLSQIFDHRRYQEVIMTRVTIPLGEDIGFLPGTEEEKMTPWMGALMDNLEVLTQQSDPSQFKTQATMDLLKTRIRILSLNFMRGRTFLNKFIIIDEAQNLTPKQMKSLITRAGPGTKIVCLGDIHQIDTPYLNEATSGLTFLIDRFKHWEHGGHVTLKRGERSRLADYASESLR